MFEDKADSDRTFEALTRALLEARRRHAVRVAIASHNLRSVAHALAANHALGGGAGDVEIQVLRGLGDDLQHALAATGHRVRTYCPVGDLVAGMAYLVRRLLENTSNESFLADQAAGLPLEELLARAMSHAAAIRQRAARSSCAAPPQRAALLEALAALDATLPLRVPVWIGDDRRDGDELGLDRPGHARRAWSRSRPCADRAPRSTHAVDVARDGRSRRWSRAPAAERAAALLRAAGVLRERRPRADRARGARVRQAVGRGRRRRLRGDRLPRVLRARRDRARAPARRCCQMPGERNDDALRAARRRRRDRAVELPARDRAAG